MRVTIEDFTDDISDLFPSYKQAGASAESALLTQTTIYHPNSRANTSLASHIPTNKPTTANTIRIVLLVFGATARVMRSAEDTRPDATELNVLVF